MGIQPIRIQLGKILLENLAGNTVGNLVGNSAGNLVGMDTNFIYASWICTMYH